MGKVIKVVLADNNEIFREGLAKLLEAQAGIEVVMQCSGSEETVEKAGKVKPDVVLISTGITGVNEEETTQRLSQSLPGTKVAVLTDSKKEKDLFAAIQAGATGYLQKDMKIDDLIKSIDLIAKGEVVVSPPLADKFVDEFSRMKSGESVGKEGLSDREVDILKLLARGATNKEIAEALFIAENTAKVHVKSILSKLQLRNRQQAAAYAIQQGLATEVTEEELRE